MRRTEEDLSPLTHFVPAGWKKNFSQEKAKISNPAVAASAEQNLIGGAVGLAGGGLCQLEVGGKNLKTS